VLINVEDSEALQLASNGYPVWIDVAEESVATNSSAQNDHQKSFPRIDTSWTEASNMRVN